MSKARKLDAKVVKEKQEIGSDYYCVLEHPLTRKHVWDLARQVEED